MYRPKRFGWLYLSLVLLVAACGTASSDQQTELAEVMPSNPLGSVDSDEPADSIPTEDAKLGTPTTRVEAAPTETETARTEKPPVSPGTVPAPAEAELAPKKAPRVEVDVKPEDVEPAIVKANPGPSEEQQWLLSSLENLGAAPELPVNGVWLNSEPRQLADLRGKVVMVEFWTFG